MEFIRQRLLHWQQHAILNHVDNNPADGEQILRQLESMGVDRIFEDFHRTMEKYRSLRAEATTSSSGKKFCPPVFVKTETLEASKVEKLGDEIKKTVKEVGKPAVLFKKDEMSDFLKEKITQKGYEIMREGKLGCILLAGGQGSRLKYDGPKGCYQLLNLPLKPTIFQLILERLAALKELSGARSIPLYIMVSQQNGAATRAYIEENNYFGLPKEDVIFFEQTVMPSFSENGDALLESSNSLTRNPNGNGGVFDSLKLTGKIADMESRGIEYVHVIGVDNVLVKIGDPLFIGMCTLAEVPVGNKCVAKAYPEEKVGVQAYSEEVMADGQIVCKPCVVEYTEISEEQSKLRLNPNDENSDLLFSAGNICNHFFTMKHIRDILNHPEFEYHVAIKDLKVYDPTKDCQTNVKGVKLEYFIFDSFPPAACVLALEARRDEEFSPVKNFDGVDSPATAVQDLLALHRKWLDSAGIFIDCDKCQIIGSKTYQGEGLNAHRGRKASELKSLIATSSC